MKKCNCGSNTFWVTETFLWKGFLEDDGDGKLDCYHKDGEITSVSCTECSKEMEDLDYDNLNFN